MSYWNLSSAKYMYRILQWNTGSRRHQQEGQEKRGKVKNCSYQYIVGYECGKGFESCL